MAKAAVLSVWKCAVSVHAVFTLLTQFFASFGCALLGYRSELSLP